MAEPCEDICDQVVLVVSNEPWGDVWYVKHHYAVELSRRNRVYFVNPPRPWSPRHLAFAPLDIEQVRDNLWVVNYENLLPVRVLGRFGAGLNDFLIGRRLAAALPVGKRRLVWQFEPFRFVDLHGLNARRVYHVADDYARHPNNDVIARRSDLVCCTSRQYVDAYRRLNPNVLHVPHGVSEDEFAVDPAEVAKLAQRFGPFLFFAGGIEPRTDVGLLLKVANTFSTTRLVIAGPNKLRNPDEIGLFEQVCRLENVAYLGPVPGSTLKNFIRGALACLVVYRFGEADGAGGTSSHKVLKYVAQRRPIISTMAPEPPRLAGHALYSAGDEAAFLGLVGRAVEGALAVDDRAVDAYLADVRYAVLLRQVALHLPST